MCKNETIKCTCIVVILNKRNEKIRSRFQGNNPGNHIAEKMKKVREKNILLSSKPDNEVIQMIKCAGDQRQ